jgi:type II secretory pathway component PulF
MLLLAGLGIVVGLIGLWVVFLPLPFVLAVLGLMVLDRVRSAEHRGLIWSLAISAERGIPLAEAARAFADELPGDTSTRALTLAAALERGEPLSLAVQSARLRMRPAVRLAVRLGERWGLLGSAMRQQLADTQQIDAALRDMVGRLFYLLTVVLIMGGVCTFMTLRIAPVIENIFEEFGLRLPTATQWLLGWTRRGEIVLWGLGLVCVLLGLASAAYMAASFGVFVQRVVPIRAEQPQFQIGLLYGLRAGASLALFVAAALLLPPLVLFGPLLLYYIGWFPRDLPVVWRAFRHYDGALVMRSLALAIRRGVPLPDALATIGECYPLRIVGRRVRQAADTVRAGGAWCPALQATELIRNADSAVLAAAERVGNLAWALEEMADRALRRELYRVQFLVQALYPVALLAVGLAVFVFAIGYFLPLVAVIQALA